jgi:hypothetical protein
MKICLNYNLIFHFMESKFSLTLVLEDGTYQESCPLGVLQLSTFLKVTSI